MLVTNHVLSGGLIGLAARGPVSAFALGVGSHLVLDAVPHWGDRPIEAIMPIAVTDGLLGLTAMGVGTAKAPEGRRLRVLAAMAGASLLDLDKPTTVFFGFSPFPKAVDHLHGVIQRESDRRMPQEILVGLSFATAYALAVRRMRRRTAGPTAAGA